jgi:hypothetical protein
MTFQERSLWAYGFAALAAPVAYFVWLAGKIADADAVADIAYVRVLLWAIGGGILLNMIGTVFVRGAGKGADLKDQRDREIDRRGNAINFVVFSILVVIPFALAMRDADSFWIANAIYLAYVASALLGVAIKAVLYRKGI